MNNTIKTRFAPSPTGLLHLGNVRTALFSALLAHHFQGIFLLRIEDTDQERSQLAYVGELMLDMRWLGLEWQEGPEKDLGKGPYWQSERQNIYDRYYQALSEKELTYPCFCSTEQLALARKLQLAAGKPPRYAGTCRNLTAQQIAELEKQGKKPTWRFKVPLEQQIVFADVVRGEQRFFSNDLGDFVIKRADGTPTFLFCNAIDDVLMGVTHVMRGEDHIANTPRQILIMQALQLQPIPHYGHISLIMGADGAPLSKRTGSRSVQELREKGFFPLAVINYLARLGHFYAEETLMDFGRLSANFAIKNLSRSPARFDEQQLLYWQKTVVGQSSDGILWQWMQEMVGDLVPENSRALFLSTVKNNVVFPVDALHWANIFFGDHWSMDATHQKIVAEAGELFFTTAIKALPQTGIDFNALSAILTKELQCKGKALFQPLRVALTGEIHGPEMAKIFQLLGADKIKQRLEAARRDGF
jgi:glutamyl-tRNA synthetase